MLETDIIDLKLKENVTDKDVNEIRTMIGDRFVFSDQRIGNSEAKGTYCTVQCGQ